MTITNYTLAAAHSATNRYTAAALVDVLLSNTSEQHMMSFTITASDSAPSVTDTAKWHKIKPAEGRAMTLNSGDRLWMASPSGLPVIAALEV